MRARTRPTPLTATALLVLMAAIATACGDGSDDISAAGSTTDPTTDTTDATEPADSTESTAEPTTEPTGSPTASTTAATGSAAAAAELAVTVTHPADPAPVTYTITCDSDGGAALEPPVDGLDAAAACTQLASPEVQSRLIDGPPTDQMCTEIFGGPDQALVGELGGAVVEAVIDRSDGCAIDDWDRLLSDVLPEAVGVVE